MKEILFNINTVTWSIAEVISAVTAFGSAIATVHSIITYKKKNSKQNNYIKICLLTIGFIFAIAVFSIARYCINLSEVPDVIGLYYSDACSLIAQRELRYSTIKEYNEYAVVVEQSIEPGQIVEKKTEIKLEVEYIFTEDKNINEKKEDDMILQNLKDKGVPFNRVVLEYIDKSIVMNNLSKDITIMCGDTINNLDINEIKLLNKDYDICFELYHVEEIDDYGVLKNMVVFDEIPAGNYELISNIEGYQVAKTGNMRLSTDKMQGAVGADELYWGFSIGLVGNSSSVALPFYITVIDEDKNVISDIPCMFKYKDNMEFGEFKTLENGNIPFCFMTTEGQKITVIMRDVFVSDDKYICEVIFDDVKNPPVIVLHRNGDSEQIGENEYLGFEYN